MSTLAVTPSVVQDIVDDSAFRELTIVSREMERPPYWFADEGLNARLIKALRVVQEDRITPNSDGSYTVEGSEHRQYRCADTCTCPQSQKGKSKWCYHMVSVALYTEWQRRLGCSPQGLPLGPASVEERLAQTPVEAPRSHEEPPMTEDPSVYIPEPDDSPVAVMDPPKPVTALQPIAPQDDLEAALQVWTMQRQVVQRFLKQELKPNIDYYTLHIGGKDSKPSLSKAGAEKVSGWLKLGASFAPDTGTWEMLGRPTDLVCFVCTLRTRSGEIVGEGRGARSIKKDNGDVNKAIKMAEKSSFVSAILRTGCLSDVFTSDLEDLQEEKAPATRPSGQPRSADLRGRIWAIVQERAPEATTRQAVERWIMEQTGLQLHPDHYQEIIAALQQEGR